MNNNGSSVGTAPNGSVLVVEDETLIRNLLVDGLSGEGYAVTTVADGKAALETLEQDGVDVVLLDLMLPGMSGFELARSIRQRWPMFIIAMSASSLLLESARHAPFIDRTVAKPFEWDDLLEDLHAGVA